MTICFTHCRSMDRINNWLFSAWWAIERERDRQISQCQRKPKWTCLYARLLLWYLWELRAYFRGRQKGWRCRINWINSQMRIKCRKKKQQQQQQRHNRNKTMKIETNEYSQRNTHISRFLQYTAMFILLHRVHSLSFSDTLDAMCWKINTNAQTRKPNEKNLC